jgi:5'-methylthioadenosine phosphorylase
VARLAVVGKQQTLGEPRGTRVSRGELGGVPVGIMDCGDHVMLYRHGLDEYVPPHRIDHAAHLRALGALGCDRVLAISSVGALRTDLPVGTFLAPDDFIALDQPPVMALDHEGQHVVPGFAPRWRERVVDTWSARTSTPLADGGVYWQANGPRFETPAEIRMIAAHADVIGMTVASECVAANQLGMEYAAVCVVDNLANGMGAVLLTPEEYARGQAANRSQLLDALAAVIPELAA